MSKRINRVVEWGNDIEEKKYSLKEETINFFDNLIINRDREKDILYSVKFIGIGENEALFEVLYDGESVVKCLIEDVQEKEEYEVIGKMAQIYFIDWNKFNNKGRGDRYRLDYDKMTEEEWDSPVFGLYGLFLIKNIEVNEVFSGDIIEIAFIYMIRMILENAETIIVDEKEIIEKLKLDTEEKIDNIMMFGRFIAKIVYGGKVYWHTLDTIR